MPDQQQDETTAEPAQRTEPMSNDDRRKRVGYDTLSDENPLICRGFD